MRSLAAAGLAALLVGSCGTSDQGASEEDRRSIRSSLEAYLPRLAEAYAEGRADVLEGLAAPKEVASVEKRLQDLAMEGKTLVPEFHELTLEEVTVWGYANAYATTVELWDLGLYASGTDRLIGEEVGQRTRVRYQLKREGDRWLVLYRSVVE